MHGSRVMVQEKMVQVSGLMNWGSVQISGLMDWGPNQVQGSGLGLGVVGLGFRVSGYQRERSGGKGSGMKRVSDLHPKRVSDENALR